jgi:transposase
MALTVICILDENGKKVKTRTVRGPLPHVVGVLREEVGQPFAVVYEASCGYGWLHDQLVRIARKVVVAHPGQLRLIFRAKRKTDRVDARKLATLLYLDAVPPVHVPSIDVRSWRGLIERRHRLVACRTRSKNGLRALLRTHAIAAPKGLWTKGGMAWLASVSLPTVNDELQRDILQEDVRHYSRLIRRVERRLEQIARSHPAVGLLRTIPGVGIRTGEAVSAYIDRADRFRRNKCVGTYFGLVPCEDTSVKRKLGHITHDGPPTVRRLLVEAAWQAVRRDVGMRRYFERIQRGKTERKKIAIVAVAHKLVRVMHAMLASGETWRSVA